LHLIEENNISDIDECISNSTICGSQTANCTNRAGSYTCTCNSGFLLSSAKVCEGKEFCVFVNRNVCLRSSKTSCIILCVVTTTSQQKVAKREANNNVLICLDFVLQSIPKI